MTPAIKICGVTRAVDAERAAGLGAWAIGMIFWRGSPRAIDVRRAREISAALPPHVLRVGVFVDAPEREMNDTARAAGLDVIQIHDRRPIDGAAFDTTSRVFRLVDPADADDLRAVRDWPRHVLPLVDAGDPVRRGGTGRTANWEAAATLAAECAIVLAGGLSPANVAAAIHRVRPFAIDVSSGVEDAPGIKSAARMRELFAAVEAAGESQP